MSQPCDWIATVPQKALDRPQPVQHLPYGDAGCPLCGASLGGIFQVWRSGRLSVCEHCGQTLSWVAYDAYHAALGNHWTDSVTLP